MVVNFVILLDHCDQKLTNVLWVAHVRNISLHQNLSRLGVPLSDIFDKELCRELLLGTYNQLILGFSLNFLMLFLGEVRLRSTSLLFHAINRRFKLVFIVHLVIHALPKVHFEIFELDSLKRLFLANFLRFNDL